MKFRNYCVVIMGDTDGAKEEILKVSENNPKLLNQKGIVISTFQSVLSAQELTDFFKTNKRNFLLFDMNDTVSGFNFMDKKLHKDLFSEAESDNKLLMNLSSQLLDEIKKDFKKENPFFKQSTSGKTRVENIMMGQKKANNDSIDYSKLSDSDRVKMIDDILDKGYDKLTKEDREILKKLNKTE